jgi:hypothetical protein
LRDIKASDQVAAFDFLSKLEAGLQPSPEIDLFV